MGSLSSSQTWPIIALHCRLWLRSVAAMHENLIVEGVAHCCPCCLGPEQVLVFILVPHHCYCLVDALIGLQGHDLATIVAFLDTIAFALPIIRMSGLQLRDVSMTNSWLAADGAPIRYPADAIN